MALSKKLAAGTIAALATGALVLGGASTAFADDDCHGGHHHDHAWSQWWWTPDAPRDLPGDSGWSVAEIQAVQSFLQAHPDIAADPEVQSVVTFATTWMNAHPGMTHAQLMAMLTPVVSCLEAGGGLDSCTASLS
jgi:hypothetical protein